MTTNKPLKSPADPVKEVAEASTAARPRPFQFSMATGLVVVTGLSIVLSLTAWRPVLGGMLSSVIVGTGWSYAALRAGRRKLAYYLAAWPMGVGAFVVGYLPVGKELALVRQASPGRDLFFLVVMALTWLLTVRFLRPLIRRPGLGASVAAGILAVYTTAALSMVFAATGVGIASLVIGREHLFPVFPGGTLLSFGVMASVIWATMVMPVAGPLGVCFCTILRRIDPEKTDVEETPPTPE